MTPGVAQSRWYDRSHGGRGIEACILQVARLPPRAGLSRGVRVGIHYAFGELDDVRQNGSNIELVRGTGVVLRLQLHGPDAVHRHALAQRLAAAVARAGEERDQPVTRFVNGATREDLSRAAEGASSYRHAAVSRDQLWAALEGPSVASHARLAAAEALATRTDPSERARLRVATEQCAEPTVRARMRELLEGNDDEVERAHFPVARRARLGA